MKFTINIPPVTKKNHQQILKNRKTGKNFIGQAKKYQETEAMAVMLIPPAVRLNIDYPVNLKVTYFVKRDGRVDITNLESAICDILVKGGVLADDSALKPPIVVSTDGSRVYLDKVNPRYEIEITRNEEYEND